MAKKRQNKGGGGYISTGRSFKDRLLGDQSFCRVIGQGYRFTVNT